MVLVAVWSPADTWQSSIDFLCGTGRLSLMDIDLRHRVDISPRDPAGLPGHNPLVLLHQLECKPREQAPLRIDQKQRY